MSKRKKDGVQVNVYINGVRSGRRVTVEEGCLSVSITGGTCNPPNGYTAMGTSSCATGIFAFIVGTGDTSLGCEGMVAISANGDWTAAFNCVDPNTAYTVFVIATDGTDFVMASAGFSCPAEAKK